jgi:predicted dehydrogenase
MTATSAAAGAETARPLARLGFVGVGWIGRHRMKAILDGGRAEAAVIADAAPESAEAARELAPDAELAASLDEVLEAGVDGVVIATPSALHADQSIAALERGIAVFCQKPLGRSEEEVHRVVDAARAADRLLGVDMSYRFTEAARAVRDMVRSGELGRIFSAELTFHNAYGPDKPWFRDKARSGGGCVMDLGVHLIDMALWTLDFPKIRNVDAFLYDQGERLAPGTDRIETFASARMELEDGAMVGLACSWDLHAGRDAVISADFHGSEGGACFRNIDGSFYDFVAERYHGTGCETLATPPDEWGGRAAAAWAARLAAGEGFDPAIAELEAVARTMDRIYGR